MKTIKRLTVLGGTVALAGMLFTPSAFAAPAGTPYSGTTVGHAGGGDYGLGNCGYNNGAGRNLGPSSGPTPGLGGYAKIGCSAPAPTSTAPVQQQTVTEPVLVTSVDPSTVDLGIEQDFFN